MNKETLERLKRNPHYKLSAKEKEELKKVTAERKPMIMFEAPEIHNTTIEKHDIKVERKKWKKKT